MAGEYRSPTPSAWRSIIGAAEALGKDGGRQPHRAGPGSHEAVLAARDRPVLAKDAGRENNVFA